MELISAAPCAWLGKRRTLPETGAIRLILAVAVVVLSLLLTGCDQLMSGLAAGPSADSDTAANAGPSLETVKEALLGKTAVEVRSLFGKPQSVIHRESGERWFYARWQIHFDRNSQVEDIFKEIASTSGGANPQDIIPAALQLGGSPSGQPTGSAAAREVTVISNGGQQVNLQSIVADGKVTVVDFYADWCGPCRKISPHLEQLAKTDPDVVLVKVDIVKWGTPVTKQHNINSVPNIRVFGRNRQQVGQPTPSLQLVTDYIKRAKT